MIRIGLTFTAGRYHATPWGRHVNEGAVEWPPSPWRVSRALIAVGFSKLSWTEIPQTAKELLVQLIERLPTYWLAPEVTTGHTRHYMPNGKLAKLNTKGLWSRGTDLVIDAFVALPRNEVGLVIEWDVDLLMPQAQLLRDLVEGMGHFGRAESWVKAEVVSEVCGGLIRCAVGETPPDARWDRMGVLAPLAEPAYQEWREKWQAENAVKVAGKPKPKAKKEVTVPLTVVDALLLKTSDLQAAGWSQPPGSRWVGYWRHPDSVVERSARQAQAVRESVFRPTTALLALSSDTANGEVLPLITQALWQGEVLHDALLSVSADSVTRLAPSSLTGMDASGALLTGHRHAHVLPLTLERRDNRVDHFLIHAPMGFEPEAIRGIQRLRNTFAKGLPKLFVTLAGVGQASDVKDRIAEFRRSRVWESQTPFVPPRFLKDKGKNTLLEQVFAECESRNLPRPVIVKVEIAVGAESLANFAQHRATRQWIDAGLFGELRARVEGRAFKGEHAFAPLEAGMRLAPRWRHFRRSRRDVTKAPPQALALGLRLEFQEPVQGPVMLGYGSHFGLGLMRPGSDS